MKFYRSLPALGLFLLTALPVHADESVFKIAIDVQQKQQLVNYLKSRIARHKKLSFDQIVAEMTLQAQRNRGAVAQKIDSATWDKGVEIGLSEIKKIGSKDVLIALETAQLQQSMTSTNLLFMWTRMVWDCTYEGFGDTSGGYTEVENQCATTTPWGSAVEAQTPVGPYGTALFISLFSVPFDLALLPIELVATILTGF